MPAADMQGSPAELPDPELAGFFQQHFPILRAKCGRMLGDTEEAADIAQEAFLRLWRSPVVRQPAAVRARFMYVTATRLAIDHLRHHRARPRAALDEGGGHPSAPGARLESAAVARQALARLAAVLAPQELEALVYWRHDRMTQEEVAAALGISARQVRRLIEKVEQKLARRKELSPHE